MKRDGTKIVLDKWECYGDDQGIQSGGTSAAEAIGGAILGLLEDYGDEPFVIDKVTVAKNIIEMPEVKVNY